MTLLAFEGVGCVRGGRALFVGIGFALAPGDALLVTGRNGVGKSSLLRIAAGLLRPTVGHVARDAGRAWLGEQAALDADRTLRAALGFWARIDGADRKTIEDAMTVMGVDRLADVPVRFLSTGQRRRAAIARTIAGGRPLWLLDEPTNGLDADGVARLGKAMAAHRAGGGAVMAATHAPMPLADAAAIDLDA